MKKDHKSEAFNKAIEKILNKYNIKSLKQLKDFLNQRNKKIKAFNIFKRAFNYNFFDIYDYKDDEGKHYILTDYNEGEFEIGKREYKLLKELFEDE